MTVFPFLRPKQMLVIEEELDKYPQPKVDFRTPSKAKWVIRESSYYEPQRIHD